MSVGYSTAQADAMLATLDGLYIQLHSGDPGPNGTANVIAGVSRVQANLAAATTVGTDRVRDNSAILNFTGMPVGAVSHWTAWTLAAAGVFRDSGTINPAKTIANAGDTFTVAAGDLDFKLGPLAA